METLMENKFDYFDTTNGSVQVVRTKLQKSLKVLKCYTSIYATAITVNRDNYRFNLSKEWLLNG